MASAALSDGGPDDEPPTEASKDDDEEEEQPATPGGTSSALHDVRSHQQQGSELPPVMGVGMAAQPEVPMVTPEPPRKALRGYDPPEWALGEGDTDVLLRMTWSFAVRQQGKTTQIIDISQQPRFVIGRKEEDSSLDPAANLYGGSDDTVSRYGGGGGGTIYITTANPRVASTD